MLQLEEWVQAECQSADFRLYCNQQLKFPKRLGLFGMAFMSVLAISIYFLRKWSSGPGGTQHDVSTSITIG